MYSGARGACCYGKLVCVCGECGCHALWSDSFTNTDPNYGAYDFSNRTCTHVGEMDIIHWNSWSGRNLFVYYRWLRNRGHIRKTDQQPLLVSYSGQDAWRLGSVLGVCRFEGEWTEHERYLWELCVAVLG